MSGSSTFFVARPIFPQKICCPSSFAQKFLAYIDRKCLQKRLFKKLYHSIIIIRIKYNYRISFSSKIDLKMNKNRKSQTKFWPVLKTTKKSVARPLLQKIVSGPSL